MRKIHFVEGEYYHIFNRGVDKRIVFSNKHDFERFLASMTDFNSIKPIGSIFENSFRKKAQLGNLVPKSEKGDVLVEFIAYCLNPNHYHLILKQTSEHGIQKLMHKLGVGYTNYFNEKNKRSGSLFQGTFKAVHIETNEQLLYLSAYVNLNNRVHGILRKDCYSSWEEYKDGKKGLCNTELILDQFKDKTRYLKEVREIVAGVREKREDMKVMILEELGN